ncbi:glycosyltransferase family 4 protein [Teredinibacter sp. KSP-S5-2]|uniref:glycosyltransferase family 4 protein n=1 Tax=Teredinibacter sp. KSP-S5-2 TaxID=3034506 RepID=UPI002934A0B3|nr:glycosyltransferase family 4 protein [Teredinibacter sp. KSP-S5-2]WNO07852.1 glycosyltransferase family 4 protein [Teredinibacter sp. KSP-S5-2]
MNVLFLGHRTPPRHGAALVGDFVYALLVKFGYNVRCSNVSLSDEVADIGGFSIKKVLKIFVLSIGLIRSFYSASPDVVYLTPSVAGAAILRDFVLVFLIKALSFSGRSKPKVVCHIHMRPNLISSWLVQRMCKFVLNESRILVADKSLISDLKKLGVQEIQCSVIPYAVSPLLSEEKFERVLREKYKSADQPKNVLYMAHMLPSKGYRRALEIAKECLKARKDIVFHFAGAVDEVERAFFQNYIDTHSLSEYVRIHGRVDDDEKESLFSKAHAMILPSYSEAYPLTIPESLSAGVPVIGTNTGAIDSIIGKQFGRTIDQEDECAYVKDFAKSLLFIMDIWGLENSLVAREYYESNWTRSIFEARFQKFIKSV